MSSSRNGIPLLLEAHDDPLPPQQPSMVRCVMISDTHGKHHQLPPLPDGDVLFHLGDVANKGSLQDIQSFASWIRDLPHAEKIVIDGNHDRDRSRPERINLEKEYEGVATFLRDGHVVELASGRLRVLGVRWDSCEREDYSAASTALQTTMDGIDILLTHKNPRVEGRGHGWHGSSQITELVQQFQIPLHCFGHVHYGRGICNPTTTPSIMVNCATAWNRPVVIDFCPHSKQVTMVHCPGREWVLPGEKFLISQLHKISPQ